MTSWVIPIIGYAVILGAVIGLILWVSGPSRRARRRDETRRAQAALYADQVDAAWRDSSPAAQREIERTNAMLRRAQDRTPRRPVARRTGRSGKSNIGHVGGVSDTGGWSSGGGDCGSSGGGGGDGGGGAC